MSKRVRAIVAGALTALGIATFVYQDLTQPAAAETVRGERPPATGGIRVPAVFGAVALLGGIALQLSQRKRLSSEAREPELANPASEYEPRFPSRHVGSS
jgi:hypothetical protein